MTRQIGKLPQQGKLSEIAPQAQAAESTPAPDSEKAVRVRRPFGQHRQKLAYPKEPGFHHHWFNDDPGRIDDAKEAGYEHVLDKQGRVVSRPVGVASNGGPLVAFLMKLPQELYDQDMRDQQKIVDETDRAIREGAVLREPGDGRYIPTRGINIREESRQG